MFVLKINRKISDLALNSNPNFFLFNVVRWFVHYSNFSVSSLYFSQNFLQYIAIVVINAIVDPWLLLPAAAMTILFYLMRVVYVNTGRSFKRIEAKSVLTFNAFFFVFIFLTFLGRSPIFSHVNATLQGLPTIHAFKAEKMLENEFHEFQDFNTSCWYLFASGSQCLALWLDLVCLLYITFVIYSFLVLSNGINAS